MKKLKAYTQSGPTWTRVELLVVAFDGVLSRLEQARGLIEANNRSAAEPLLLRSQRIVMELYSGTDIQHGKIPENMQQRYLFVLSCIGLGRELDLTAALERPFTAAGKQVRISGSVGIALFPDHALTSETLLAGADAAMYRAKADRPGQVRTAGPSS